MTPVRFGTGLVGGAGSAGDPAVYYEVVAPLAAAAKPPILLLHGGTQTGNCFLRTADGRPGWAFAFARNGYRAVVPDWPGSGRSGAVANEALDGAAVCRGIGALLESLGEPAILLTHSMSGAFGWRLVETHGTHIARIVAIAPGPPGNIQAQPEIVAENDDEIEVQALALRHRLSKRLPYRAPMSFVERKIVGDGGRFPRAGVAPMAAAMGTIAPRLIYERLNIRGAQLKVRRFENFRGKPILIMTGSHDIDHPRALDAATAEWLAKQGAAAEFVYLADLGIVGNGHMMMMEDNSDALAALVVDWLENRRQAHRKAS
jgi:pimeloyl-ACP methyl ester carboxylesterase